MSALQMVVPIHDRLGCDLSPLDLDLHPTIEQLARLIELDSPAKIILRSLITFQSTGSRCPIFFVHPIGGSARGYQNLALNLGADYPSFGVNARAFAGGDGEISIELLASRYIAEIQ